MDEIINGWFSEFGEMWPGRALSLQVEEKLYSTQSQFQKIDVYRTKTCGTALVLDGIIQCTESDEFAYQEMMTHIAMFSHPAPERVLVIGGGDGGVLREIERHSIIQTIDICEIDEEVINTSKKFLPQMACGFDDDRVNVHIADGSEFIRDRQKYYDVIIVDSSDPVGPAETLFTSNFYEGMKSALRENGIIAAQGESIFLHPQIVQNLVKTVAALFPLHAYAHTMVPTYPGGGIGVCLGSLGPELKKASREPEPSLQEQLKYYSPRIHVSSFVLPYFAEKMLENI